MKIGVVTDFYFPWIGGPSAVVHGLGIELADRGHSVSVLAPSASGPPSREFDGPLEVQRARTGPLPFGYNVRMAIRPRTDARRWLDRVRPDVLHFHHPFPLSAAASSLARKRGIPVVATNHTIPECSLWGLRQNRALYDAAYTALTHWLLHVLRSADAVATPTHTAAQLLRNLGYRDPIIPISNGIDTVRFSPGPKNALLRAKLNLDDRPIVLYTGRLDAEKQMDVWLRSCARLTDEVQVQFVVGGRGSEQDSLHRLAASLDLSEKVTFIGYVSDVELPDVYRLADVYFVTSTVELQSIATLEAIASGLPAVAVRAGALPELVHHGTNGFLVPPGDAAAAAGALRDLLCDEETRRSFGLRSRDIALGHDLLRSVERYESLMIAVMEAPRGERQIERAPAAGR